MSGVVKQDRALFFEPRSIDEMARLAKIICASNLFDVKSPEQAAVIMMTAASLGINVVAGLRGIHIVKGKPVLAADLMAAVVLSSPECKYLTVIESTNKHCIIETWREGAPSPVRKKYGEEEARAAGLIGGDNYKKNPADMYHARAMTRVCRAAWSDKLFGCYGIGELDDVAEPVSIEAAHDRVRSLVADSTPLLSADAQQSIDVEHGSDSRQAVPAQGDPGPGYTEDELPFT